MPDTQLASLLQTAAMREAASAVLEESDARTGDLQWDDVSDAVSSSQWGRLISAGVLTSTDTGFVVADPDELAAELAAHTDAESTEHTDAPAIESASWTIYDKAAAVGAIGLFAGYWNSSIQTTIASVDNQLLAPVMNLLPFHIVVLVLAVTTGVYSTYLQSRLMDHETLQAYKDRMAALKERREAAKERGDDEALERIQSEQMDAAGDQLGLFKLQFRPMVWIMLLTIPVFLWLRWEVRGGHLGASEHGMVVPLAGHVAWQHALLGPMATWIVWYFVCSMASRQFLQKTFNIQAST
ncbi:DUF106 domain-containing protein [Halobacterium salinarum]|uniref:DUF106 family protein n=1 Tax=Halobacterium salinarum (strain ATCC 33171 / DSM 3754 / JCM 8978 / NBRC 102687 / NCIMB 764 / 91-R6) TaxID=2597657 RepID=A0A4D6GU83_HALS9|nr:DUF106 domain-containing protein [Halobacterium salinarum]MDL0124753.1 DUF106 domain-containing protein [Halobacterium salinarum]MDL0136066.1 DUF106 domain-containing protein [Halobacterium salinarum]MDL0144499.1 DUF106 domain-containing protein [Halobacterium salinarum]QCC44706.1 DUF106 family protein [Halobacterium salinarum]TYO75458.1 Uncharacterized membrane protein, DUF106 family [Halobacterium salinarum DSM 3754]